MSAVRVLLVIYDEPARQALRSMLAEASGIVVAGEAASVVEALLEVDDTSPDVVLIDAEVHGVSGVEMIRLFKDRGYDWPVVALGANLDSLDEALRAGALGYTTKESLDEELVDIIGRVSEGVYAFGPSVMGAPRGMKVALRYMSGEAGADGAPASSPVPGDEATNIKIAAGLWLLGMVITLVAAVAWIVLALIAADYYSIPKAARDAAQSGPGTLSQLATIEVVKGWVKPLSFVGLATFLLGFGFAFAEILANVRLRADTMAVVLSALKQRDGGQ